MEYTVLIHAGVLGLSATVAAGIGVYTVRSRSVPGQLPFALFMFSVAVWAAAYALGLLTHPPGLRVPLEATAWFGRATAPVWICLFALAYTGYDGFVTRRTVAALLLFPATMIALVWAHPWNDLVWMTAPRVVFFDGLALVVAAMGPLYWAFIIYAYALILVAAALLVRLVFLSEHLYLDQSGLLLVGIAAPVAASAMTAFPPHPIPGFDYAPYGFVITGLAFGYSLFRRRLFELVPATRQLGRDAAIRQLEEGVLIVDTDGRVIYCNPAAAEMLDCAPRAAIGEPVRSFVDEAALTFEGEDALIEWEHDDGVSEIRTSPVRDRRSRLIGHTLVIQDITARKHRERRLARQRDKLERLDDLNALIRGVNRALVSATDRADIERAVCERLADSDLFRTACAADIPTWNGTADRWTVAGATENGAALPSGLDAADVGLDGGEMTVVTVDDGDDRDTLIVIPIVYGQTVYGALGLRSWNGPVADGGEIRSREREVLAELGGLLGHAINAAENRQLLAAESVVELELHTRDPTAPLVRVTRETDRELGVTGLIPNGGESHLAYVRVADGDGHVVADALAEASGGDVRVARERETDTLLEWTVPEGSLFGTLVDHGANVLETTAADDTLECVVEVASDTGARALVERLYEAFPDTQLVAKRERERPAERVDSLPGDVVERLTDRQREALEVAYRAGYFEWPRENTAEDVAETLDVTPPTVHYHLRQAEEHILDALFDADRFE
jgi:predicted DNA binding protein/PAS domain-containing protein